MWMHVCVCVWVPMYVRKYACIDVRMCMYVGMCERTHVCMQVRVCMYGSVCMCACMSASIHVCDHVSMHTRMYVCSINSGFCCFHHRHRHHHHHHQQQHDDRFHRGCCKPAPFPDRLAGHSAPAGGGRQMPRRCRLGQAPRRVVMTIRDHI